ncbi:MAG: HAD-IA family hydrolase, partial [Deltaproteobacteria bacterium]|nr:HAD-IA family hydrolase [Deltaproteobacteria bacterium]
PAVAGAVEAYFSAFYDNCRLIPGTTETLGILKGRYRIGLLSNFTHAPAAREILDRVGLTPLFDAILISGELGYRKPHPLVFDTLVERMGVDRERILFVGDDPEPDIQGASRAGLQPVWISYVMDRDLPSAAGILGRGTEIPGDSVPRISQWKDLLALLGI